MFGLSGELDGREPALSLSKGRPSPHWLGLDGRGRVSPLVVVVARFLSVWETGVMAKRSLRTLKRVSNIPSLGICESCHMQFSADPRQLGQAGVQQQFNAHKCEAMQNAAPGTKDAAKKEAVKKEAVKREAVKV